MKLIHKTYKFELHPTKEQIILLNKNFGCSRFVYNYFLNQRKEQYQENKKSDNYYTQCLSLTKLKNLEETKWLGEVNAQSLQFTLKCLETSYVNFFKKRSQFPKFKSKRNKNTFTIPQFNKIKNGKYYAPKFKAGIKVNIHREIKGVIGKCTISKTPTGRYFISILSKEQYQPKEKTGAICGVDLGLKDFVITSDNIRFKNNRYTRKYSKKLKRAQQHLSRKTKGSNQYEKQRLKVAKIYEKITNSRMDTLHKVSTQLVSDYDIICLENLNIKGMLKNKKLSKHISDAAWGTFVTFVDYKANWNDKRVVKINRFYPSTKTCNECGWINQNLNLSMREWICKNGHKLDRDHNAAINILKEGLNIISSGVGDYTDGDKNKTSVKKHKSMKPVA